jgi:phage shock protein C
MKKLYRSDKDKVFAGVIGGLGEYLDIDSTVLRLGFVVLVLMTGIFPGVIAYAIALFLVPKAPHTMSTIVTPPPMETPKPTEPVKPEEKMEENKEEVKTETTN